MLRLLGIERNLSFLILKVTLMFILAGCCFCFEQVLTRKPSYKYARCILSEPRVLCNFLKMLRENQSCKINEIKNQTNIFFFLNENNVQILIFSQYLKAFGVQKFSFPKFHKLHLNYDILEKNHHLLDNFS